MIVDAKTLSKFYNSFGLRIPRLHIDEGKTFGLVGNNGAGKTTFLRLLLDLIRADGGEVRIGGELVAGNTAYKECTGSYLGEGFLIDFLTPDEQFDFTGKVYGLTDSEIEAALDPFRDFYTDEPLGETTKYIRSLSQGNRKKVGLIAAMFTRPKLLILDEPFTNLDPRSQIQCKDHLRRLHEEEGTTMVISSHDLGHVTEVTERIALLEDGRIVRDEPVTEATLGDLRDYFAREIRSPQPGEREARGAS